MAAALFAQQPFFDRTHYSKVFGETRHYRIILPPGYEISGKRYPVIYYFHGHSDRYTVEHYDNGTDTIPKRVDWVARTKRTRETRTSPRDFSAPTLEPLRRVD